MAVINNLESTSPTDALSANMGRELDVRLTDAEFDILDVNTDISSINTRVTTLENNPSGSCDCETKIWTEPVA